MERVSSLKTGVKYKDTPIGKIPVDWEVVRVKDIALRFLNGGTPDTTNKNYWDGDNTIGLPAQILRTRGFMQYGGMYLPKE